MNRLLSTLVLVSAISAPAMGFANRQANSPRHEEIRTAVKIFSRLLLEGSIGGKNWGDLLKDADTQSCMTYEEMIAWASTDHSGVEGHAKQNMKSAAAAACAAEHFLRGVVVNGKGNNDIFKEINTDENSCVDSGEVETWFDGILENCAKDSMTKNVLLNIVFRLINEGELGGRSWLDLFHDGDVEGATCITFQNMVDWANTEHKDNKPMLQGSWQGDSDERRDACAAIKIAKDAFVGGMTLNGLFNQLDQDVNGCFNEEEAKKWFETAEKECII